MSRATLRAISHRSWDWVVLQEQSIGMFEARFPFARTMNAAVAADGAATAFLMTWRDRGNPPVDYDSLRGVVGGTTGYVPIAHELGARVAPVGWAFRNIVVAGSPFDLWQTDGHHANRNGSYLAGLVVYATLTGQSPVGVWAPKRLDSALVVSIQQFASDTVFQELSVWNIVP